ncbi:MAG: cupin domain-containing protein [Bacteroidota bacterium]
MSSSTAAEVIFELNLKQLPWEGGYYSETYRSTEIFKPGHLGEEIEGERNFSTAIYYLLTPDTFSFMHQLKFDEVFHFYMGDPVEMLLLDADGSGDMITLGHDIKSGMKPQYYVRKHTWQGSRLADGGEFALMGTTMSPGFDFKDYIHGDREKLIDSHPQFKEQIIARTN